MNILVKMRKYRIGPYSAPDLIGTILIFYWISKYLNTNPLKTIFFGLVLSIVVHSFFKVNTPLTNQIIPSCPLSDSIDG